MRHFFSAHALVSSSPSRSSPPASARERQRRPRRGPGSCGHVRHSHIFAPTTEPVLCLRILSDGRARRIARAALRAGAAARRVRRFMPGERQVGVTTASPARPGVGGANAGVRPDPRLCRRTECVGHQERGAPQSRGARCVAADRRGCLRARIAHHSLRLADERAERLPEGPTGGGRDAWIERLGHRTLEERIRQRDADEQFASSVVGYRHVLRSPAHRAWSHVVRRRVGWLSGPPPVLYRIRSVDTDDERADRRRRVSIVAAG
jgi:hypothetical protein